MARSRSDALPRIMSPPTLPHPNPSADTRSPVLPSSRYSMRSSLSREPARRRADPEALEGLARVRRPRGQRSEEHTSELQSQSNLVCRLLLEKKKTENKYTQT